MAEHPAHDALCKAFGTNTCHGWPAIPLHEPRWWQRRARRVEKRITAALAAAGYGPLHDACREAYWRQVHIGQGVYEDAGGYIWRCWSAALGIPYEEPTVTYRGLAKSAFDF